jgi:hypothetical protein
MKNIISTHTFTAPDGRLITYTKLKPRKARRSELILSQTKGIRTNTNRGKINTKQAAII